jgi:hypothetical protein
LEPGIAIDRIAIRGIAAREIRSVTGFEVSFDIGD